MRPRPVPVLAALTAAIAFGVGSFAGGAPARADGINFTGRRAPDIYVVQGIQGVRSGTTLATYAGKVLVLKFWFAGCPTCRASLPEFEALSRRYAGREDVQFLALAYDTADNVEPLLRGGGYTFPVGLDPSGNTAHAYGVETYPTHYVIGADGFVKSYDDLSSWVIDREVASVVRVPVESPRERNIKELGEVPASLVAVKEAAGANDYGQVLRLVEAHLDPAKDPHDVVAHAKRIQAIAWGRFTKRSEKLMSVWNTGDHGTAWRLIAVFEADFAGTSVAPNIAKWIAMFPGPRPGSTR